MARREEEEEKEGGGGEGGRWRRRWEGGKRRRVRCQDTCRMNKRNCLLIYIWTWRKRN